MANHVYEELKARILTGAYASGEIINEKALADELNVSRTPIRESLARLEWERLVKIIPRAGAMVAPTELRQVKESYDVRLLLDGELGRLAAGRITQEQIADLKQIRIECLSLIEKGTQTELNEISHKVRRLLGEAAGNGTLLEMSDQLFNVTIRVWQGVTHQASYTELAAALLQEIDSLIIAFEAGDRDAAEKVMRDAIAYYTGKLRGML